jgi:ankyrin repeat protein
MPNFLLSLLFKPNRAALRSAIIHDNTNEICRIIKEKRVYLCQQLDEQGNNALLCAIQYASPSTVGLLLQHAAHPDQPNFVTFQTPLGLLASTTFTDEQSNETRTAVELAVILLDHGAYVDKCSTYTLKDNDGNDFVTSETPLMSAVRTGNLPMATLLVERNADLNYTDKFTQYRP